MINRTNVRPNYYLGSQTDLITFFKVGYLIKISVKWKLKKNGCNTVPITAKAPYAK